VSRFLANTVDFLVIVVILTSLWVARETLSFLLNPASYTLSPPDFGRWLVGGGVLLFLYLLVFWATSGRTYGARVMGLHVVNFRGDRLRWSGAALRSAFCVGFPLGIFWVAVSSHNRSLQDAVLRTSVIYDWETPVSRRRRRRSGGPRPVDDASPAGRPRRTSATPPTSPVVPTLRPLPRMDDASTSLERTAERESRAGHVHHLPRPAGEVDRHLRDGS
jgi:uncharacterized RDD family membrane protein YckC